MYSKLYNSMSTYHTMEILQPAMEGTCSQAYIYRSSLVGQVWESKIWWREKRGD